MTPEKIAAQYAGLHPGRVAYNIARGLRTASKTGWATFNESWLREHLEVLLTAERARADSAEASLTAAREECERLRKALEFYGNNWRQTDTIGGVWIAGMSGPMEPTDALFADAGSRARAALQQKPEARP